MSNPNPIALLRRGCQNKHWPDVLEAFLLLTGETLSQPATLEMTRPAPEVAPPPAESPPPVESPPVTQVRRRTSEWRNAADVFVAKAQVGERPSRREPFRLPEKVVCEEVALVPREDLSYLPKEPAARRPPAEMVGSVCDQCGREEEEPAHIARARNACEGRFVCTRCLGGTRRQSRATS